MNIQEPRQAGFEKFLAEQKKWIEEYNLEPLTATEIGSMIRAWDAALDSQSDVVLALIPDEEFVKLFEELKQIRAERDQLKAEVEELRKDAERLDWIDDNYEGFGGGQSFNLRLHIPHDIDDGGLRHSIDAAITKDQPK